MWLIGLPAWGDRYLDALLRYTIPSILACDRPQTPLRIIVHTDQPEPVSQALRGIDHVIRPVLYVDGKISYSSMSAAHQEVMGMAAPGDFVTLMCADVIFSKECFVAAERRFAEGYKAVACTGTRTVGPLFGNPPPLGMSAAELLHWAVVHFHPIMTQCTWPHGRTQVPSQLYFETDDGVVARVFTPCLFAVVNDRNLHFTGTIDRDLLECFERSEIHVVTTRDELAVVEVSPMHKSFGFTKDPMTPQTIARWSHEVGLRPLNYWFFDHCIEMTGTSDGRDRVFADEVLREVACRHSPNM